MIGTLRGLRDRGVGKEDGSLSLLGGGCIFLVGLLCLVVVYLA